MKKHTLLLACAMRILLNLIALRLRGWQRNWIHRGAPRPANPVTCFPPGKVVAPATKGGMHFLERSEVGLFSDARQGGIKIGAESAAPRQRSDTI